MLNTTTLRELEHAADIFLACAGRPEKFSPTRAAAKGRALARLQRGYSIFRPKSPRQLTRCEKYEALDFNVPASHPDQQADGLIFSDPLEIILARETLAGLTEHEVGAALHENAADCPSRELSAQLNLSRRQTQRVQKARRAEESAGQGELF